VVVECRLIQSTWLARIYDVRVTWRISRRLLLKCIYSGLLSRNYLPHEWPVLAIFGSESGVSLGRAKSIVDGSGRVIPVW
jgi:hypothetical protein